MKTSEFKKIIKDNGLRLKVLENVYEIYSKDLYLCSVGKEDNYIYIDYPCPKNIAQTIVDYAYTHREEREEEKRYYLRTPTTFNENTMVLNYYKNYYLFAGKLEDAGYKTKFTQKEIDDMQFNTSFFIKEEVK